VRSDFSSKTLEDVNNILDNLAMAHGREEKVAVFRDQIINQFCSVEQKWLMRIVFQDLKIGLKYEAVMNYLSPTALQRYNECTNLRTVCEEDGGEMELTGLRPFIDFKPMLAKGYLKAESSSDQLTSVHNAMKGQAFAMDVKLDGERMMIHIRNGKMMMFTRNGSDYTDAYRQLGETVKNCICREVTDCILDGEVCAWNQDTKSFMRFGHNAEAGREERETYDLTGPASLSGRWLTLNKWLVFIVFDIVYVDGPDVLPIVYNACDMFKFSRDNERIRYTGEITHFPLCVRREILKSISSFIGTILIDRGYECITYLLADNRYEFIKHKIVASPDVNKRKEMLEDYFNEVSDS
jgi:ATP-dependent DNA ligase